MLQDVPTTIAYGASNWDSQQLMACVCDVGFFGADCSQRRCATGDDPITACPDTVFKGQVQEIKVTLGSKLVHSALGTGAADQAVSEGMELFGVGESTSFDAVRESESSGQVLLGATDAYGQVHYAPTAAKAVFARDAASRGGNDPAAASVEIALENVRNYRVDNVKVTAVQTGLFMCPSVSDNCPYGDQSQYILEKRYLVTFVPNELNSANFGAQQPLVCKSGFSCPVSGCAPMVKMPFLYRYASTGTMEFSGSGGSFAYFAGKSSNTQANFALKSFVRLSALSSPQLPMGMTPDAGVSATSASRYDVRIVVAVQDPSDSNQADNAVDVYWTKVTYGNVNIATDSNEYSGTTASGAWSSATDSFFAPTLLGFTYRGNIPATLVASVPDATGVVLDFPDQNMIASDSKYRFFEILVKLPACEVTPLASGAEFKDVAGAALTPVDPRIENVECSNRGQCNRASGLCECFSGFCASRRPPAASNCKRAPNPKRPLAHAHSSQMVSRARR